MAKRGLGMDVLTAAQQRISRVFDDFPRVYCSFSGGKDSGVLLELAAVEARRRGRRIGVLIVDLEAQYKLTIDYIADTLARHADVLDPYWVALPLNLRNAVSQYQPEWMCWDPDRRDEWVRADQLSANDYNPNTVAAPEMRLLQLSIMQDGYTQPIVAWPVDGGYEVVDGFHRNRVGREVGAVTKRVMGRLPISVINSDRTAQEDRVAATIRHNRARGVHQVDAMSEIVLDLARRGKSDDWIAEELGMEPDEVLRLKQVTAMAVLFADRDFSEAWEAAIESDEEPALEG